jgi:aminopeptidase
MADSCYVNLAKILVQYSTQIGPKDKVMIIAYPPAGPLVVELFRLILQAGAYPHTHIELEELDYLRFTTASDDQLGMVNPIASMVAESFDAHIEVLSKSNTRDLTNADPDRQTRHAKAYAPLSKLMHQRAAEGSLRWVLTAFPTYAYAQEAQMSLTEYKEYVFRTTYADLEDPLARWEEVRSQQQGLVDWFQDKKQVKVRGANIDMQFLITDRAFINEAGKYNLPDGEIFTAPIEQSASGWIRIPYPAVFLDRQIEGIELTFDEGKVVKATARKNEDILQHILRIDPGSSYIGEFGFGLNPEIDRYIRNPLFDEKMNGTIHIALGAGYPESGSKNDSAIHWDLVCEMREGGEVEVDGEVIYQDGLFKVNPRASTD